jgi:hypothetical protein
VAPEWQHYKILIGQFYVGVMDYLFFVNDHDVAHPNGDSYFANIRVYEE